MRHRPSPCLLFPAKPAATQFGTKSSARAPHCIRNAERAPPLSSSAKADDAIFRKTIVGTALSWRSGHGVLDTPPSRGTTQRDGQGMTRKEVQDITRVAPWRRHCGKPRMASKFRLNFAGRLTCVGTNLKRGLKRSARDCRRAPIETDIRAGRHGCYGAAKT